MATCKNCGSELAESAKFCENCGAPVEVPEAVAAVEETVTYESTPVVATAVNTPEQESACKTALVLSIIGLALCESGVPGIIFSAIAKSKVKKAKALGAIGGKLKTAGILATIGLVVSIVMTVVWVIYAIAVAAVFGAIIYEGIDSGTFEEVISELNSL
ncbi:MAG: zinc ribbon domain-containing protein [Clostridia bacterium]|nr:zinc ribbon domain-containing protein [Clostridia bacterium]